MLGEDVGLAQGALGAPRQPLLQTRRVERMTLIALQGDDLISSLSRQRIGLIDRDIALVEPLEANRTSQIFEAEFDFDLLGGGRA